MNAFRDIRILPVVLIAIFGLAVLKIAGLVLDGGYVFDYDPKSTKPSWAQENLNFPGRKPIDPDITGSVHGEPKKEEPKPVVAPPQPPRETIQVKAVRPDLWISAATITYNDAPTDLSGFRRTRTYTDVMQDWPTWMQTGLIDLNVLMNYKRDAAPPQGAWFDRWNAFAQQVQTRTDGQRAALAAGTAMYLNAPQVTAAQAARYWPWPSVKPGSPSNE